MHISDGEFRRSALSVAVPIIMLPLIGVVAALVTASPRTAGSTARLSAILFDIDGTLFNSDDLHLKAFQDLLMEYNYDGGKMITEAFFMKMISGRQNSQIVADLFPDMDASAGAAFSERKEARFRELAGELLPSLATPGLNGLLGRCEAAGVRCAAVTNAPRANAELMLGAIGRLGWFQPLIIGDECSAGKPDPEPYLRAMRELGVTADECIAFEDSTSGATAAVAARVKTIGITTTQSAEKLQEAGCSFSIQDFESEALQRELNGWRIGDASEIAEARQ